jgi:hypothetical protein
MPTPTLEEIQQRIKRNYPSPERQAIRKILTWDRETATTIKSSCGTYRICRVFQKGDDAEGFNVTLCATPTAPNRHLSGPFLLPRDAREAAQRHADGIPLQADLS